MPILQLADNEAPWSAESDIRDDINALCKHFYLSSRRGLSGPLFKGAPPLPG